MTGINKRTQYLDRTYPRRRTDGPTSLPHRMTREQLNNATHDSSNHRRAARAQERVWNMQGHDEHTRRGRAEIRRRVLKGQRLRGRRRD